MTAKKYPSKLAERKRKKDPMFDIGVRRAHALALIADNPQLVFDEQNRRKDRRRMKQQAITPPSPTGDFFFLAAITNGELRQLVNNPGTVDA